MNAQTIFVIGTVTFLFLILLPILALVPASWKWGRNGRLPNKVAAIFWICVISYYIVLFNTFPKYVAHPWMDSRPTHQVEQCKTITVYDDL